MVDVALSFRRDVQGQSAACMRWLSNEARPRSAVGLAYE